VDNYNAIYNGALANNTRFFGGATAETISAANNRGSWNGESSNSPYSSSPWFQRGGRSDEGAGAGIFYSINGFGGASDYRGHRTILSGY
jgi:hypothetical protein